MAEMSEAQKPKAFTRQFARQSEEPDEVDHIYQCLRRLAVEHLRTQKRLRKDDEFLNGTIDCLNATDKKLFEEVERLRSENAALRAALKGAFDVV